MLFFFYHTHTHTHESMNKKSIPKTYTNDDDRNDVDHIVGDRVLGGKVSGGRKKKVCCLITEGFGLVSWLLVW